jgi:hypothetical protein
VPAAAVIPAPIAYTKVVAVKKLVVGFLLEREGQAYNAFCPTSRASCHEPRYSLLSGVGK